MLMLELYVLYRDLSYKTWKPIKQEIPFSRFETFTPPYTLGLNYLFDNDLFSHFVRDLKIRSMKRHFDRAYYTLRKQVD